eukprot:TRINITY_DN26998_c0_g1_i1.p1 TRINITY_DN26998_c0_g1~~TRINITY_DN26998_c0_g1_i1.p1  ORF type:complete len:1648 (+),score=253.82 TRINITY_DN26998_c0_g1_i1:78-5021(+)
MPLARSHNHDAARGFACEPQRTDAREDQDEEVGGSSSIDVHIFRKNTGLWHAAEVVERLHEGSVVRVQFWQDGQLMKKTLDVNSPLLRLGTFGGVSQQLAELHYQMIDVERDPDCLVQVPETNRKRNSSTAVDADASLMQLLQHVELEFTDSMGKTVRGPATQVVFHKQAVPGDSTVNALICGPLDSSTFTSPDFKVRWTGESPKDVVIKVHTLDQERNFGQQDFEHYVERGYIHALVHDKELLLARQQRKDEQDEELRVLQDGVAYTYKQLLTLFGEQGGQRHWEQDDSFLWETMGDDSDLDRSAEDSPELNLRGEAHEGHRAKAAPLTEGIEVAGNMKDGPKYDLTECVTLDNTCKATDSHRSVTRWKHHRVRLKQPHVVVKPHGTCVGLPSGLLGRVVDCSENGIFVEFDVDQLNKSPPTYGGGRARSRAEMNEALRVHCDTIWFNSFDSHANLERVEQNIESRDASWELEKAHERITKSGMMWMRARVERGSKVKHFWKFARPQRGDHVRVRQNFGYDPMACEGWIGQILSLSLQGDEEKDSAWVDFDSHGHRKLVSAADFSKLELMKSEAACWPATYLVGLTLHEGLSHELHHKMSQDENQRSYYEGVIKRLQSGWQERAEPAAKTYADQADFLISYTSKDKEKNDEFLRELSAKCWSVPHPHYTHSIQDRSMELPVTFCTDRSLGFGCHFFDMEEGVVRYLSLGKHGFGQSVDVRSWWASYREAAMATRCGILIISSPAYFASAACRREFADIPSHRQFIVDIAVIDNGGKRAVHTLHDFLAASELRMSVPLGECQPEPMMLEVFAKRAALQGDYTQLESLEMREDGVARKVVDRCMLRPDSAKELTRQLRGLAEYHKLKRLEIHFSRGLNHLFDLEFHLVSADLKPFPRIAELVLKIREGEIGSAELGLMLSYFCNLHLLELSLHRADVTALVFGLFSKLENSNLQSLCLEFVDCNLDYPKTDVISQTICKLRAQLRELKISVLDDDVITDLSSFAYSIGQCSGLVKLHLHFQGCTYLTCGLQYFSVILGNLIHLKDFAFYVDSDDLSGMLQCDPSKLVSQTVPGSFQTVEEFRMVVQDSLQSSHRQLFSSIDDIVGLSENEITTIVKNLDREMLLSFWPEGIAKTMPDVANTIVEQALTHGASHVQTYADLVVLLFEAQLEPESKNAFLHCLMEKCQCMFQCLLLTSEPTESMFILLTFIAALCLRKVVRHKVIVLDMRDDLLQHALWPRGAGASCADKFLQAAAPGLDMSYEQLKCEEPCLYARTSDSIQNLCLYCQEMGRSPVTMSFTSRDRCKHTAISFHTKNIEVANEYLKMSSVEINCIPGLDDVEFHGEARKHRIDAMEHAATVALTEMKMNEGISMTLEMAKVMPGFHYVIELMRYCQSKSGRLLTVSWSSKDSRRAADIFFDTVVDSCLEGSSGNFTSTVNIMCFKAYQGSKFQFEGSIARSRTAAMESAAKLALAEQQQDDWQDGKKDSTHVGNHDGPYGWSEKWPFFHFLKYSELPEVIGKLIAKAIEKPEVNAHVAKSLIKFYSHWSFKDFLLKECHRVLLIQTKKQIVRFIRFIGELYSLAQITAAEVNLFVDKMLHAQNLPVDARQQAAMQLLDCNSKFSESTAGRTLLAKITNKPLNHGLIKRRR